MSLGVPGQRCSGCLSHSHGDCPQICSVAMPTLADSGCRANLRGSSREVQVTPLWISVTVFVSVFPRGFLKLCQLPGAESPPLQGLRAPAALAPARVHLAQSLGHRLKQGTQVSEWRQVGTEKLAEHETQQGGRVTQ